MYAKAKMKLQYDMTYKIYVKTSYNCRRTLRVLKNTLNDGSRGRDLFFSKFPDTKQVKGSIHDMICFIHRPLRKAFTYMYKFVKVNLCELSTFPSNIALLPTGVIWCRF